MDLDSVSARSDRHRIGLDDYQAISTSENSAACKSLAGKNLAKLGGRIILAGRVAAIATLPVGFLFFCNPVY
jgi:hypothetical protein